MHQYSVRARASGEASPSHALTSPPARPGPEPARADALGHRFGTSSSAPIQMMPSKFADQNKRRGHIYTIRKRANNKVVYVGQTDQTIKARWKQHLRDKPWLNPAIYKIRRKRSGNWTPFRMTAYEQHYINRYGGKAKLRNKINAMTKKKYNMYKNQHKSLGHRKPY